MFAADTSTPTFGAIELFFGCRNRTIDLYREEKDRMIKAGVIDKEYRALSREPGQPKVGSVLSDFDASSTVRHELNGLHYVYVLNY